MENLYCNPVPFSDGRRHTNPDPYILRWCGRYYCYATDENGVKVSVSEDMVHWEYKGFAIRDEKYHHFWAPSVIYLNGMFYMYYSNIPIEEEDCHEEHLKLAVSEEPLGPFVYRKTFFEKFSIDSHPVMRNGELYMFYSVNDWIGLEPKAAGTCILLDKMVTPEEFAGEPKAVVLPSLPQEIYAANRFGDGRDWYTIEGASPVFHGDKCWMLYSANAFENIYYFVGTAVAGVQDELQDMVWKKYPNDHTWMPLLKKNKVVEGTGHNTVAKAPDLFGDWIVYHGRDIEEGLHQGTEQRNMRIDPLLYFGDRMFCPGPSYQEMPAPGKGSYSGREIQADGDVFFAEAPDFYRMEIWCSAELSHAGAKYMIYLDHVDERNYVGLKMHSGMRKAAAVWCNDGIVTEAAGMDLPKDYDFSVPHLIGVKRRKEYFRVTLDEDRSMEFRAGAVRGNGGVESGAAMRGDGGVESENSATGNAGRVGAGGCFTPVTVHSVTVSEGAELRGKDLFFLPAFYECSAAELGDGMLRSLNDALYLSERDTENKRRKIDSTERDTKTPEKDVKNAVAESFRWRVLREDHQADLYCGDQKLCTVAAGMKDAVTFYYYRGNGRVYVLTDGAAADRGGMEMTEVSGITILSAECRENACLKIEAKGLALEEYSRIG